MKNNHPFYQIICAIIVLANSVTTTLYAQQNAIKINPPFLGNLGLVYEHAYDSKNTMMVEFQKWNLTKRESSSIAFLGIISTVDQETKITGYRTELVMRHYRKKAFHGGFLEGGIYFGKHDIEITKTSTTFNTIAIFLFEFDSISETETQTFSHKDVQVGGGKIGGGYQKALGHFDVEFSGGININALNSKNVRPILSFKGVSPYFRAALGIAF